MALSYLVCLELHGADSTLDVEIGANKQHITADRTLYHSNDKVYEAFGHVVIGAKGQRLTADYAWINTQTNELRARGNVILVTPTSIVNAAELHYNLETQTGTIFYGRVANEQYVLKGQLIRKISEDRFLTTDGEYTTCLDCPESWKLAARNVDLTFEGYAFMESAFITIKDTPTLYIPYMVLPVKRKRQTGLLFPRMGTGAGNGFMFVQPLFIAIDDHQDMTLGYGTYSKRGRRLEFEYRYKSYGAIGGQINAYFLKDRTYLDTKLNRYALKTENNWTLYRPYTFKWRLNEVSDHDYIRLIGDIGNATEPALESNVIAQAPFDNLFVSAEAKRYRNLLFDHPYNFDGGMVQAVPSVYFGLKERSLLGPIYLNANGRFDHFQRHNGAFDDDNNNKKFDTSLVSSDYVLGETIRETDRFILTPSLSAPFRVGKVWSLAPSIEYNQMNYRFGLPSDREKISFTQRQYLVARLETSTVLEKIYNRDNEEVSKTKHQIIPKISYSYVPWQRQDNSHPFSSQIERTGGAFDQFDIVPITNSTNFLRLPLGNSITYGLRSSLINKQKRDDEIVKPFPFDFRRLEPKKYGDPVNKRTELGIEQDKLWDQVGPAYGIYQKFWDFSVDQAYDIKEAHIQRNMENGDRPRAFSRLLARSNLGFKKFGNTTEYTYYPRLVNLNKEVFGNVSTINTSFSWTLESLANSRGTLFFKRAFNLSFSNINRPTPSRNITGSVFWSINDFLAVERGETWDLLKGKGINNSTRLIYNSASECWQIGFRLSKSYNLPAEFSIDFGVNLFGVGYTGLNQINNQGSAVGITPVDLGPLGGGKK